MQMQSIISTAMPHVAAEARPVAGGGIGTPVLRAGGGGGKKSLGDFRAAARGRLRGGAGATARGGSADFHRDHWTLDQLRKQTRSLQRNNKLSQALVQRTIDMVVADGPRIQVKAAGGGGEAGFNAAAEKFLREWGRAGVDHRSHIGINGRWCGNGLAELCGLAVGEAFEAGDVWALPTNEGRVQMIEAERILTPSGMRGPSGAAAYLGEDNAEGTIINGVEYDPLDRPVAVHVASWMDKWNGGGTVRNYETTRVPIGSIVQLAMPLHRKPNLTRPEPGLTAVLEDFEQIAFYIRDVAKAADMAAYFGLALKTGSPQDMGLQLPGSDVGKRAADNVYYTQRQVELEPGFVLNLDREDDVVQIKPEQPTTNFDSFVFANLAMIGAQSGLPLSLWLLDMRQVNFASARVAVLLAGSVISVWRRWLAERLLIPILQWRLHMALQRGGTGVRGENGVVYGVGKPGGVPAGYDDIRVGFPPLPVIDTGSQYQAEAFAVEKGLKTFEDVQTNFFGRDYREHIDTLSRERKEREERGILPVSTPGAKDPNLGTKEDGASA